MTFSAMAAAGHGSSCGVRADNSLLFCWGHNDTYQLGREPRGNDPAVLPTAAGLRVKLATTSDFHHCAITTDDETYCWGNGANGQLGSPIASSTPVPQRVSVGATLRTVSAGMFSTCGATAGGEAYCWGENLNGQLGIGAADSQPHPTPARVAGLSNVVSITAGEKATCAITAAGAGYCWGSLAALERAVRTIGPVASPFEVAPGYRFRSLAAFDSLICGVTVEERLYCW